MMRTRAGRSLLTAATYLASLVVTAAILVFPVLVLAGPHGGILPAGIAPAVLPIAWLIARWSPWFRRVRSGGDSAAPSEGSGRLR